MGTGDQISVVIFSVLAGVFFLFEVRVVAGFFTKERVPGFAGYTRRKGVRIAAIAAAVLLAAAAVDAFFVEPDWVVREHIELASKKINKRVRIVHISDLHTEGFGKRQQAALDIVAKAEPDIIVLTGDYLNGSQLQYLPELREFVSRLEAPMGIYAVEGNFEYSQKPWHLFKELGIRALDNEAVHIKDANLVLCGLQCVWDLGESEHELMTETVTAHAGDYMVVLTHYPNHIEEPELAGADLYLCGHTHGGQVRFPLWGAIITLSKLGKRYECGHYENGAMNIYVNRGLGMEGGAVPRARFLCRPEIAVIDIIPEQ